MSSAKAKKLSALAALKAKRDGLDVPSHSAKSDSEDDNAIYDEVSEDEYRSIIRGRIMEDDFIEDDDGSGYVDHGQDEWNERRGNHNAESDLEDTEDEQDYFERTGRKKPKKTSKSRSKLSSSTSASVASAYQGPSSLSAAFNKQKAISKPSRLGASSNRPTTHRNNAMDAYRPAVSREKEEDFMANLIGNLDESTNETPSSRSLQMDPASPTPSNNRLSSSLNRKRKQSDESAFLRFRNGATSNVNEAGFTSPSSGPATSDSLHPPSSDGVTPHHDRRVHVSGSDTPPWGPNLGSDPVFELDDHLPPATTAHKKLRASRGLPSRIGSLGLDPSSEANPDPNWESKRAQGLPDDILTISDDDLNEEDIVIRRVEAGAMPTKSIDVRGQKNQPAKPSPPKVTEDTPKPTKPKMIDVDATPSTKVPAIEKDSEGSKNHWQSVHNDLLKNVQSSTTSTISTGGSPAGAKSSSSISTPSSSKIKAFESDNSLHFYWIDYLEGENGVVYLVGKVKDKESGRFVSCCLTVNGIERCIFLLPRNRQLDADDHETDKPVTEDDVYEEFEELSSSKHNIKRFLSKWVTRKYAFEQAGVPAESNYMKIRYGFDEPQLPFDFKGRTFSKTFGTNTSAFELLVIKRRIFGPSWLKISNATCITGSDTTPVSWCKFEVSVDDPKDIQPVSDADPTGPRETPPLTVMSLSIRTVVNHKENKQELVAVSARTWVDHQIEDPTPIEKLPSSIFTAVRPLGPMFPPGFETEAKKSKTKIHTLKYERMLLNSLLATIHNCDPDVIVGHEFNGVSLDILLHRMKDLRAEHFSRIGRFRRPKWPKLKQGMNLKILAGRLVCDLASDNSKSMISSTTWSLTEMCSTHLKVQREDIDPEETASFFDSLAPSPERLLTFVRHNEVDTFFQMAIASKVQILPLTKQLTNLAGNSWNKTLNGGRAERNEYILLHDFHRQKFICPDKISAWEKKMIAQNNEAKAKAKAKRNGAGDSMDSAPSAVATGKKDKFKGGLVFEPKRGLWDKYILVMDFNSLYPSIIQEFNIDFTTVQRPPTQGLEDLDTPALETNSNSNENGSADANAVMVDTDKIPEIPSSDVEQGVLPRIIAQLVSRRRQVKGLMKDKTASPSQLLQWNIKQLALKLTANSMYGCLGFENSRFYARPLAALTTFKGREILTSTKDLAESMLLDVIYGDTDSVMINTNASEFKNALKIGQEFKKLVNEKYKLLEIDIDGVFERMLLLQKKKYAAVLVQEDGKKSIEIKGLDMKRREYSSISKQVSQVVLDKILSGQAGETVIEEIHEYLATISNKIEKGEVPMEEFIIYKKLGKNPEDYPDVKSQPHVQVALRMKQRGGNARMGDVIPYIFCLSAEGESSIKTAQANLAFHPDEIRKDKTLRIDYHHYLALQILPPIQRLCESINGTDRSRLAECLGLDPTKFSNTNTNLSQDEQDALKQLAPLESQVPDSVRFAHCQPLVLTCPSCRSKSLLLGPQYDDSSSTAAADKRALQDSTNTADLNATADSGSSNKETLKNALSVHGIRCTNPSCLAAFPLATLQIQLELAIRTYITKYYASWSECTDPNCGSRTRMATVYPNRCCAVHDRPVGDAEEDKRDSGSSSSTQQFTCRAKTAPLFTDKALYTQLLYFHSLFDVSSIKSSLNLNANTNPSTNMKTQEKIATLQNNHPTLTALAATTHKHLNKNARRFVKLDSLFRFMNV